MKKLLIGAVMALVTLALPLGTQLARADSGSVDFETGSGYSLGNPDGQNGWTFTGYGTYDAAISGSNSVPGFGDQSLRISNAVTSGSFGDWVFSQPLTDDAGESTADNGGLSGGTRQNHFDALFHIASQTGATQPGLQISVSPDRGDGARMSFLRFKDDGSGGTDVMFTDYQDKAPFGTDGNPDNGCGAEDDFVTSDHRQHQRQRVPRDRTPDGLPRGAAQRRRQGVRRRLARAHGHELGGLLPLLPREGQPNTSRTVDSLLFQARTGGGTAPDTLGQGS